MENNQEHKIDKIFKKSLENQLFTPPSDAWMGIHTYTIGQEESKKRVWLRYASLALLILLFSGFGLWYYFDIQTVVGISKPILLSDKLLVENTNNGRNLVVKENAGRVLNPDSVKLSHLADFPTSPIVRKHIQKTILSVTSTKLLSHVLLVGNTNNGENTNISSHIIIQKHPSTLLSHEVDWSGDQPRGGENTNRVLNPDSVEKSAYSNDNMISPNSEKQIENIESKPLIFNDLSGKMQKESERKIVILEENIIDKKAAFKVDSAVYGKRFSLKHPIISYGLGFSWSNWNMNDYYYFNNFTNQTTKGVVIKVGVAWKLSKKARLALGFKFNGIGNIDINHTIPPQSARLGGSTLTLTQINSDFFYNEITPFGNVNIPANLFKDWNVNQPSQPSLISNVFYTSPHSIRTFQTDVNIEYDLSSYERKNGFSYQFYAIGGMNVQRQTNYTYNATNFLYGASSSILPPTSSIPRVFFEDGHLQNGTEFVFGANVGLGFRWQFAKKWSLNLETIGQTSLNSWVKNLPYTTKQTMFSLQGGIQLNL